MVPDEDLSSGKAGTRHGWLMARAAGNVDEEMKQHDCATKKPAKAWHEVPKKQKKDLPEAHTFCIRLTRWVLFPPYVPKHVVNSLFHDDSFLHQTSGTRCREPRRLLRLCLQWVYSKWGRDCIYFYLFQMVGGMQCWIWQTRWELPVCKTFARWETLTTKAYGIKMALSTWSMLSAPGRMSATALSWSTILRKWCGGRRKSSVIYESTSLRERKVVREEEEEQSWHQKQWCDD